jgi:hypothetical protein
MVQRYSPQGAMNKAHNGPYVSARDYENLAAEFKDVVESAARYFKQIETRELTAADAETIFTVRLKILS